MPKQPSGLTLPEWRERLEKTHKELQQAMRELIHSKNYSAAEMSLNIVDRDLLDLIEKAGGRVIRSD